jgi:hypothetical protein
MSRDHQLFTSVSEEAATCIFKEKRVIPDGKAGDGASWFLHYTVTTYYGVTTLSSLIAVKTYNFTSRPVSWVIFINRH